MQHDPQLSRGPLIDTQACVASVGGNKYDLVLIAAARAKEIKTRNKTSSGSAVDALLEIQNDFVGREYLNKVR